MNLSFLHEIHGSLPVTTNGEKHVLTAAVNYNRHCLKACPSDIFKRVLSFLHGIIFASFICPLGVQFAPMGVQFALKAVCCYLLKLLIHFL